MQHRRFAPQAVYIQYTRLLRLVATLLTCSNALDLVRSLLPNFLPALGLGQQHLLHRLNGDDVEVGVRPHLPLEALHELRGAGDGSACPNAGHEHVHVLAGVGPNLGPGRLTVDLRVGRVLELRRSKEEGWVKWRKLAARRVKPPAKEELFVVHCSCSFVA